MRAYIKNKIHEVPAIGAKKSLGSFCGLVSVVVSPPVTLENLLCMTEPFVFDRSVNSRYQ